ncbi:rNA polymerase sigma-70 factor expansion family 1 [Clostridium sp. CAG:273]|nr:rNA polymerase sigma-70 factor expansion family 1 [Clostridium sp. CAG:273]
MGKIKEKELKELFIEIKNNNKIAFEKLYSKYNKTVYGIAFSILKNKPDSEDVVQTVFTKIYTLEKDKLPKDKIGSWLYSVTKNETLLLLRKKDNNVNLEDIYSIKDENNEIYKFISQDSYNRLINSLNPKEQEVVSLKLLSNLTFKEIGSLLGESTNTVKWRYYKAIHTLKITLSNLSMFIITFVFGIIILKNDKKELPVIKDDQNNINSNKNEIEAENKENEKLEDSEIIQENEDFSENTIVEEQIMDTTNYLSIGMFSVSAIFLILTIIFSIFFNKTPTKCKEKSI